MENTRSVCRHESVERLTSTLLMSALQQGSGRGLLTCSECSFRFAVDLGPHASRSHVYAVLRLASVLCALKVAPSSSWGTDNSSWLVEAIRAVVDTFGREVFPVRSQRSASNSSDDSLTFSQQNSAVRPDSDPLGEAEDRLGRRPSPWQVYSAKKTLSDFGS